MPRPPFDTEVFFPIRWYTTCTPRILVVTDRLSFRSADGGGLTEFVDTLRATPIHGMAPIVTTAVFGPVLTVPLARDPVTGHLSSFKFNDTTHGVDISRYDVVFILAINHGNGLKLTDEPGALDALTRFMQAGGGVFATGDHDVLGADLCMDIPRVRSMRRWRVGVPSGSNETRLTTTAPGRGDQLNSNDIYDFDDQQDRFPQRLYPNFRTTAGGLDNPHPLLQIPGAQRAIEVFPDHAHEGECILPTNLASTLATGEDEWPMASNGSRTTPEAVALTMSCGNRERQFQKSPVIPRSFIAVCAYDGHSARNVVGRVVTDATWHHFVNINIKPGMAEIAGRDLADIKQYYSNLAVWLMPKKVRRCLRFPLLASELLDFPLREEWRPWPKDLPEPRGAVLRDAGATVRDALLQRWTRAEVAALIDDTLQDALGEEFLGRLSKLDAETDAGMVQDLGLVALGALTHAIDTTSTELQGRDDIDGHKDLAGVGLKEVAAAVTPRLMEHRKRFARMTKGIDTLLK
jgi:hypothetical protein